MPVRLVRPYNGQNANTLYVGLDENILRCIGIADDYVELASNYVAPAIPFVAQSFRAFANTFSAAAPAGSFITTLSNPFAGQGRGNTTYTLTGTVPGQIALSASGRSLVVGNTAAVAGTVYTVTVTATSGDGLLTSQPVTLNFRAISQNALIAGYGGSVSAPTPTPTPTPTPAPITTIITRQRETLTIGSSSFGGTGSTATVDTGGKAVPAEFIGVTIQNRLRSTTLPSTDGTAPVIQNVAGAGGYGVTPIGIRDGVRTEFAAGRLTGRDMLVQYGGNFTQTPAGEREVLDCVIDSDVLLDANRLIVAIAYHTDAPNISRKSANRRVHKYFQQKTNNRLHGFYDMSEGHALWDGASRTADDIRLQSIYARPVSLKFDTAHDNGQGYATIVDKGFTAALGAINDGPLFIPTMDYFAKLSGPGVIGNLAWHGSLSNTTITCQTAGYSVAVSNGNIVLSLTGTAPKTLFVNVVLRVTRVGFNPIDYIVRVSVSTRTTTAPAIVDMNGGFIIIENSPLWSASSRKFSAVFILQFTEDAGGYANISGNSDGRIHYLLKSNGFEIARQASGNTTIRFQDAANTSVQSINATLGGNFKKDRGMRAIFISYDADQPSLCKAYLSAGIDVSTGLAAAGSNTSLTPANSGTLALNAVNANETLTYTSIFSDARSDNWNFSTNYVQGKKANVWMVNDFIDFSVAANRALFFNETTAMPVDLGNDAGTVLGITPTVYLPGDAAELWMGSTNAYDHARGGATAKNHGSYGDLTSVFLGTATTL